MKSFEYKNGVYEPTCGVWVGDFFEDVIKDVDERGELCGTAVFNGVSVDLFYDSRVSDIHEKYDYKRAYLQLKAKYED